MPATPSEKKVVHRASQTHTNPTQYACPHEQGANTRVLGLDGPPGGTDTKKSIIHKAMQRTDTRQSECQKKTSGEKINERGKGGKRKKGGKYIYLRVEH